MKAHGTLNPLDVDLKAILEAREAALDAIVHLAMKYRAILRPELRRLRVGADPGPIRAVLEQWRPVLRQLKRAAKSL